METIKIEDKKYGDVVAEIYRKSIWVKHEDGTKIEMSATQALQIASAINEAFGEWVSVDVKPPNGTIAWIKRGDHIYETPYICMYGDWCRIPYQGKASVMDYQPSRYQPIQKPKP